jgi:hypothetical protein
MNEERDKFLCERMGMIWHEEGRYYANPQTGIPYVPDFSTWPGFGLLWEWAIKQHDWWTLFKENFFFVYPVTRGIEDLINPDRFANALFEFLKKREGK